MPQSNGNRMAYALALDPGGTTGVAAVRLESEPWVIEVWQLTDEHHLLLAQQLNDWCPETIICESFHNVGNEAARLMSSEYIGIVKLYAQATDTPVVWQSPATGKEFWTDLRLKQCGIYIPGLPHARDAIRHYAYWRTFTLNDRAILQLDPTRPRGSARRSSPS
jgi:hypothetical protein